MLRAVKSSADLWLMRKSFTNQMALITFMSYVLCIGQRHPSKFFVSKKNGNIWVSEFAPSPANTSSLYSNQEAVPFRFTPNIQQFIAPIGVEGVFTSSLMAIARSLTEPEVMNAEKHERRLFCILILFSIMISLISRII